jgi:hypothetical protein
MAESIKRISILAAILANGGITVRVPTMRATNPRRGYAVGATQQTFTMLPVATATESDVRRAMLTAAAAHGTRYAGAWIDGEWIHVDPTAIVRTKRDAIALGRENRQRAIRDFANAADIAIA